MFIVWWNIVMCDVSCLLVVTV